MTCIIGISSNGKAFIGADSLGSNGLCKATYDTPKLFEKFGLVFGYTTTYRFGQIIQHHLTEKLVRDVHPEDFIVQHVVPEIRSILQTHGARGSKEGIDFGGNCIIGYSGEIYELQSDFSVLKPANGICCVGSGEYHAMGAMLALSNLSPRKRIERALQIASEAVTTVGAPFNIVEVPA